MKASVEHRAMRASTYHKLIDICTCEYCPEYARWSPSYIAAVSLRKDESAEKHYVFIDFRYDIIGVTVAKVLLTLLEIKFTNVTHSIMQPSNLSNAIQCEGLIHIAKGAK